jgi:hypothetical protein
MTNGNWGVESCVSHSSPKTGLEWGTQHSLPRRKPGHRGRRSAARPPNRMESSANRPFHPHRRISGVSSTRQFVISTANKCWVPHSSPVFGLEWATQDSTRPSLRFVIKSLACSSTPPAANLLAAPASRGPGSFHRPDHCFRLVYRLLVLFFRHRIGYDAAARLNVTLLSFEEHAANGNTGVEIS